MKNESMLALVSLFVLGCGQAPISTETESLQLKGQSLYKDDADPDDVRGTPPAGDVQRSSSFDYFHCFESGDCAAPALSSSSSCLHGRDYSTSINDNSSSIIVLSFHGGNIEPGSTGVASALASKYHFNHYDFSAHGSDSCLGTLSDLDRLHITATHFDDPAAVSLVQSHKKAVAIHGYSTSRGNHKGTLCVGGANSAQIAAFISFVNKNAAGFDGYALRPIDAATAAPADGADCSGLTGTSSKNLVNQVDNAEGGLQLEMNRAIKVDLLDSDPAYDALREVIYGAINAAMQT